MRSAECHSIVCDASKQFANRVLRVSCMVVSLHCLIAVGSRVRFAGGLGVQPSQ